MNSRLIALNIATNQLTPKTSGYTLDFDNVVVQTEKQDAKLSYIKTKGYHPNIAFIGRLPVHIENHNEILLLVMSKKELYKDVLII